jgi:hypothetical protein
MLRRERVGKAEEERRDREGAHPAHDVVRVVDGEDGFGEPVGGGFDEVALFV